MQEVRLLLTAVQYFTRVPMPRWVGHGAADLTGTTRYFPAVGIVVGAVGAMVFWAASMAFPAVIAAILSTIATAMLTGALHEDGLADTMDGLGGGHTRERALEIMKDPRIGAFGALSLMLLLTLKIATLSALLDAVRGELPNALPTALSASPPSAPSPGVPSALASTWIITTLIAGHALSRWCAVLLVWRLPYARADGSTRARPVVERVTRTDVVVATVFGVVPLAVCFVAGALAGLLGALAATVLLGVWYRRRLGGYTGDTLGATQQITEVVFYLAMLAAWNWR